MSISYFQISYPNFVLNQIIDPDEANQNNYDISEKINEIIDETNLNIELVDDVRDDFEEHADNNNIHVSSAEKSKIASIPKKVITRLGDIHHTDEFVFNHNLDNNNLVIQIEDTISGELVLADIEVIDSNNLKFSFAEEPFSNQYRVTIFA